MKLKKTARKELCFFAYILNKKLLLTLILSLIYNKNLLFYRKKTLGN
jgi:hypothetical protein